LNTQQVEKALLTLPLQDSKIIFATSTGILLAQG